MKKLISAYLATIMLSVSLFASVVSASQDTEKTTVHQPRVHKQPTKQELEKHMPDHGRKAGEPEITTDEVSPEWVTIVIRLASIAYSAYKTYNYVSEEYVEGAIEEEYDVPWYATDDYALEEYLVGPSNDQIRFILPFGDTGYGMEHILGKHHPKYYYGIGFGTTNTMFYDTTTMEDIGNMINIIAWQGTNSSYIHKQMKAGSRAVVTGYWLEDRYKLIIDDNKVISLYPDGWNSVTYDEENN